MKETTDMARRILVLLIAIVLGSGGIELGDSLRTTGEIGFARPAQAIVGRPLTPVSVAGVARRSVRRCAVGVYNC
jgi:hypothetical protein